MQVNLFLKLVQISGYFNSLQLKFTVVVYRSIQKYMCISRLYVKIVHTIHIINLLF